MKILLCADKFEGGYIEAFDISNLEQYKNTVKFFLNEELDRIEEERKVLRKNDSDNLEDELNKLPEIFQFAKKVLQEKINSNNTFSSYVEERYNLCKKCLNKVDELNSEEELEVLIENNMMFFRRIESLPAREHIVEVQEV